MNGLKKITLTDIGVVIPAGGGDFIGKTVALYGGEVAGFTTKVGQYGESKAFAGNFIAVNNATGEVFDANTLYFPGVDYAEMVANQIEKLEPGATMSFQVEIAVVASKQSGRGYTFVCREISTPEVLNKKAALANDLKSKLLALPAPKFEETAKAKKSA